MAMLKATHKIAIRFTGLLWLACALAMAMPGPGLADRFSDRAPFFGERGPPLLARSTGPPAPGGSLFAGAEAGLATIPGRNHLGPVPQGATMGARLRDLIARAAAGRAGYDAVQSGAHRPPPRPPTRLTLQEIFEWIDATPGQHHAIGRYQIIPATLRRLVARAGLDPRTVFGPSVQDHLADMLLDDAGLDAARRGDIAQEAFLLNLAKVWAGLPTSSGRSYYHGVAGNRAVLSYDSYANAVEDILGG